MTSSDSSALAARLLKLAALYRAAQLFAQQCHWLVTGPTFQQDHAFLSGFYKAYASATDDLVERAIGVAGVAAYDGPAHHTEVMDLLMPVVTIRERHAMLLKLRQIEQQMQTSLQTLNTRPGLPLGVGDLLQRLAGESDQRAFLVRGFLE